MAIDEAVDRETGREKEESGGDSVSKRFLRNAGIVINSRAFIVREQQQS
jgi:hypothetical protein